MARYLDRDVAIALEIVRRNKGIISAACVAEIQTTLNAPGLTMRTIRNWWKGITLENHGNSVDRDLVEKFNQELDQKLEEIAHKLADYVVKDTTINRMTGQAAMYSLSVAIDKMRLLRNLPTQIVSILPKLVAEMEEKGIDVTEAFQTLYEKVKAQHVDSSR